jgi:hypothetical protein
MDFTKEIKYVVYVPDSSSGRVEMVESEVTKIATFKELSRKDPNQKKLFWKIISLFEGQEIDENELKGKSDKEKEDILAKTKIEPSTDKIAELTDKAIKTLLISTDEFTEQDKVEFLSDSIACINFGLWFLNNKCKPFFLKIQPG